jgi:hypothetical protein
VPGQDPIAYVGDSARRMPGCPAMPTTPRTPIAVNQTIITGPKTRPTAAVPRRCTANSTTMITAVIGTTSAPSDGWTTLSPSTADSTEMAGVIMLSPKNSEAPKMPAPASSTAARRPCRSPHRRSRAMSAMMPPSPSLLIRIASST